MPSNKPTSITVVCGSRWRSTPRLWSHLHLPSPNSDRALPPRWPDRFDSDIVTLSVLSLEGPSISSPDVLSAPTCFLFIASREISSVTALILASRLSVPYIPSEHLHFSRYSPQIRRGSCPVLPCCMFNGDTSSIPRFIYRRKLFLCRECCTRSVPQPNLPRCRDTTPEVLVNSPSDERNPFPRLRQRTSSTSTHDAFVVLLNLFLHNLETLDLTARDDFSNYVPFDGVCPPTVRL